MATPTVTPVVKTTPVVPTHPIIPAHPTVAPVPAVLPKVKMKNLRILATEVGDFKKDDVVPGYALIQANPNLLVDKKLCCWTDDPATVVVSTETLAAAAPDSSTELLKAHSALMGEHKTLQDTTGVLHEKCLDLEAKNKALTDELSQKVQDVDTFKGQRDKALLEVEAHKTLLASEKESSEKARAEMKMDTKKSPIVAPHPVQPPVNHPQTPPAHFGTHTHQEPPVPPIQPQTPPHK